MKTRVECHDAAQRARHVRHCWYTPTPTHSCTLRYTPLTFANSVSKRAASVIGMDVATAEIWRKMDLQQHQHATVSMYGTFSSVCALKGRVHSRSPIRHGARCYGYRKRRRSVHLSACVCVCVSSSSCPVPVSWDSATPHSFQVQLYDSQSLREHV